MKLYWIAEAVGMCHHFVATHPHSEAEVVENHPLRVWAEDFHQAVGVDRFDLLTFSNLINHKQWNNRCIDMVNNLKSNKQAQHTN